MPSYFNSLGSSTVNGTTGQDLFFAFTFDTNFDHLRPDALISSLSWTTALLTQPGTFFTITAQYSDGPGDPSGNGLPGKEPGTTTE